MDWGAPKTSELTSLVRSSGFAVKNSNAKITDFIFQKLIEYGYSEKEINFETIINVIEELIVYYSKFNKKKKTTSLMAAFLSANFEHEILNFSIEGNERKHGYKLQIPEGVEYIFAQPTLYGENPNEFFFLHLLSFLLSKISNRISNYAYHSSSHTVIEKDSDNSLLFREWIRNIEKDSILRLYTLNYDRIFKILLAEEGIDSFEGFDNPEGIMPGNHIRANVPRILTDFDTNVHYNLHGSAFWSVLALDKYELLNPEIVFLGVPHLPANDYPCTIQIEKGKPILLSNIITGYQKAQRGFVTPYKQMQSAFDRDCCFADNIYIVGYGVGDEHINQSIKTALRYNNDLSIEIIDPFFIENEMDYEFALKIFPYFDSSQINPKKIAEDLYSYFDHKFRVYTLSFQEYLNTKQKENEAPH